MMRRGLAVVAAAAAGVGASGDACDHMPCFGANSTSVLHIHIAKMAGRSVMDAGAEVVGLERCGWNLGRFWGDRAAFARSIARHGREKPPCFASFEASWDEAMPAYGADSAVVAATMLRAPLAWTASAVEHMRRRRHAGTLEEVNAANCFGPRRFVEANRSTCGSYAPLADYALGELAGAGGGVAERLDRATARLRAMLVGVVEPR